MTDIHDDKPDLNGLGAVWHQSEALDIDGLIKGAKRSVFKMKFLFIVEVIATLAAMVVLFVVVKHKSVPIYILFGYGQVFCLWGLYYAWHNRNGVWSAASESPEDLLLWKIKRAKRLISYLTVNLWLIIPAIGMFILASWAIADLHGSWSHPKAIMAIKIYIGISLLAMPAVYFVRVWIRKIKIKINKYNDILDNIKAEN